MTFLTTFAQLRARLNNFLGGWLFALGIKKGLVECAAVCVKSVVLLKYVLLTFKMVVLILPVDAKIAKLRRSLRLSPHSEKNMNSVVKKQTLLKLILVQRTKPEEFV